MAVIADIVEPLTARIPDRHAALSGRVGRERTHLQPCRVAGRAPTRTFRAGSYGTLCKVCSAPGKLTAATSALLADLLVLEAAAGIEEAFRRSDGRVSDLAVQRVQAQLAAADAYHAGPHPQGTQLRELLPGKRAKRLSTRATVAAAEHNSDQVLDTEMLRVFTGDPGSAEQLWAKLRGAVSAGVDEHTAVEMALDSVAHRGELTIAMLPAVLRSGRGDHSSVAGWMQHEWSAAAAEARMVLAAQVRGHLAATRHRAETASKRLVAVPWMHKPVVEAAIAGHADRSEYRMFNLGDRRGFVMLVDEPTWAWIDLECRADLIDLTDDVGADRVAQIASSRDALELAAALRTETPDGVDVFEVAVLLANAPAGTAAGA